MRELLEEYSLLFAVIVCIVGFFVWNGIGYIYFKYFDSDKKRLDRINRDIK